MPDEPTKPARPLPDLRPLSLIPTPRAPTGAGMSALDTIAESSEFDIPEAAPERHEVLAQRHRLLADMFGVEAGAPRQLGHYEILGELGRGGMGVVYEARDRNLGRKVAIKQLQLQDSTLLRRRLVIEAQAMAQLAHPNVVSIYEIGECEGATFIVMEYVQGVTLRAYLGQGEHSISELLGIFRAAGTGLAAAHAAGMVHRDFKLDNVMVGDDARVRVMDFGLASADRGRDEGGPALDISGIKVSDRLTPHGAVLGTPRYMAPEQLAGARADPKSDQFAFCVTLYRALYGDFPFKGETIGELLTAIERGEIRQAPRHSRVPGWLRELVTRGLSAASEDRFASMEALFADLDRGLERSTDDGREPPAYVFVVHADADKLAVLQLCQALLDRGIRPWLDLWELDCEASTGGEAHRREILRDALLDAPAVLVCHGPHGWGAARQGEDLRLRMEADRSSVYGVWLPEALERTKALEPAELSEPTPLLPDAPRVQLDHDPHRAAADLETLAALIGADPQRHGWLAHEREQTPGLAAAFSPYRGLEVFREQDARWMFGREAETADLLELLDADEPRFLTLIGASGSGKSSLVMAGVCPALRNGAVGGRVWSIAKLRPGPNPCEVLAHAMVDLAKDAPLDGGSRPGSSVSAAIEVERLRQQLLDSSNTLKVVVHRLSGAGADTPGRLLLVIDQLEELFSEGRLGEDDARPETQAFVANLLGAARACPNLRIIATLRADFVQRCLEIGEIAQVLQLGAKIALPPMAEAQLRAAIIRPARRVGYEPEPELVEKLVAAAAGHAGRLPLLQHLLRQLWQRRDRDARRLTFAVYAETGGLERAIAIAAEAALTDLCARVGPQARLLTRRVMTRLVHLGEGERGHTRRRASAAELGVDKDLRAILDAFIGDARVLVASEVDGGEVFEIAHEALLREWSTLQGWLAADREALRLRQELSTEAGKWAQRDQGEYLWGRARVSEAERMLAASTVELNAEERRFLAQSRKRASQRQRLVRFGGASVTLVAVMVAAILIGKNHHIDAQRRELSVANGELETKTGELETKTGELETRTGELVLASSEQSSLLAASLVEKDREDQVCRLILSALDPYLSLGLELPEDTRARLTQALVDDAVVIREARTFQGHRKGVYALALSPDGEHFASGSLDHSVKIWSLSKASPLFELEGHEKAVSTVAYDPTGARLVSASMDGTAILWDAASGARLHTLDGQQGAQYAASFSPGGDRVATAGVDGSVQLWSALSGAPGPRLRGHLATVRALAFAPEGEGERLVTGDDDGALRIWNVARGTSLRVLDGHTDQVTQIVHAPDGAQFASASWDGTVRLWTADGDDLHTLTGHHGQLYALSYSPDGSLIASAGKDGSVRVWETRTGALHRVLDGHRDDVRALSFSPDSRQIASGSRDRSARVWELATGRELAVHRGQGGTVRALAYALDGSKVISASFDGTLASWDPKVERAFTKTAGHDAEVGDLAFSPDGGRLVTGGWDGRAIVWSTLTGAPLAVLPGSGTKVSRVSFSSDGALTFTTTEGQVQVWTAAGELRRTIQAHTKAIYALHTGPGGAVVTTGWDKYARIWDSAFARTAVLLKGHTNTVYDADFSPSEDRIVTTSYDASARIWDALTGEPITTLEGHEDYIYQAAYSPDGQRVATVSKDGSARIWDAHSGRVLTHWKGDGSALQHLAFSPSGGELVIGGVSGEVKVLSASTGTQLRALGVHEGGVHAILYSPRGDCIASAGADGKLRITDTDGGAPRVIDAHGEVITEALFSPNGELITTASMDHTAKLWRADTGGLVATLRTRVELRGASAPPGTPIRAPQIADIACARLRGAEGEALPSTCESAASED